MGIARRLDFVPIDKLPQLPSLPTVSAPTYNRACQISIVEGIMPSFGWLITLSVIVLLGSLVYQNPQPLIKPITNSLAFKVFQQIFEDTYCYVTIRTNSEGLPHAECFSVADGKFRRVFLDETSYDVVKERRKGHVIPGLWDSHGHLSQFGESLDSVDLFGTASMDEVKQRLVEYKAGHEEAGTDEQWLRGVGWDQANFKGKWPLAVRSGMLLLCSRSMLKESL